MTDVQDRHTPAVLANRLQLAGHWNQPCLGYLLVGQPDARAAVALTAVQDMLLSIEPSLLCLPAAALHCTAAFLIPVFSEFGEPKDAIWRRHGRRWADTIASTTATNDGAIPLRFRQLIITDAAIIAVADQPNPISELRHALAPELNLPWPISKGNLVHITLARYRDRLSDPAALLRRVLSTRLAVDTEVSELLLVRETVFPMLEFEVLRRFEPGCLPSGLLRSAT
jgi:hypothetical protein